MLWMDYYFYLMELPEPERVKQISMLIAYWHHDFSRSYI